MSLSLRNYQLPGNNIAYIFSDAAGANACTAMYELNKTTKAHQVLFSNRKNFVAQYASLVQNKVPEFKTLQIDTVFTGTSHPESSEFFEIRCLKQAKTDRIHTISFIDHWSNFKLRFEGLTNEELPDEIWVLDETAKKLAISEGLPEEKLIIRGNPYHAYLKTLWKPVHHGKSYLASLGIDTDVSVILFAPDPLSIRNGREKFGFDEAEVLVDLLSIIRIHTNINLIIKCHPLQPTGSLMNIIEASHCNNCFLIKDADTLELVNASDLVIGFYSNLLLEAAVLGKPIVRYYPGNQEIDPLRHKKDLKKICTRNELIREIEKLIEHSRYQE